MVAWAIVALVVAGSVRLFPDDDVAEFEIFTAAKARCARVRLADPGIKWAILYVYVPRDLASDQRNALVRFRISISQGTDRLDACVLVPIREPYEVDCGDVVRMGVSRLGGDGVSGVPLVEVLKGAGGCTEIAMAVEGAAAENVEKSARVKLWVTRPRWRLWHYVLVRCRVPGVAGRPPLAEVLAVGPCTGDGAASALWPPGRRADMSLP